MSLAAAAGTAMLSAEVPGATADRVPVRAAAAVLPAWVHGVAAEASAAEVVAGGADKKLGLRKGKLRSTE